MSECPFHTKTAPEIVVPERIQKLPVRRGFHVPWFVAWIDGEPEFRMSDQRKYVAAVKKKLCWVCGEPLGKYQWFVIGPMCAVNRNTSEPPCHLECARYSALTCPFLSNPAMKRRDHETVMAKGEEQGGIAILRNPGVTCLWQSDYRLYRCPLSGKPLVELGAPGQEWYARGQKASRAQVLESIDSGMPILMECAEKEGAEAVKFLKECYNRMFPWLPA